MNVVSFPDIRKAFICTPSQLSSGSPTNLIPIGFRKSATLTQTEVDKLKSDNDVEFRNKVKFAIPIESFGMPMANIAKLLALTRYANVDCEIVLPDLNSSSQNQTFKFSANSPSVGNVGMGLAWSMKITPKERVTKFDLQTSVPYEWAELLVTAAKYINGPHSVWGSLNPEAESLYTAPSLVSLQYYNGTSYTDVAPLQLLTNYELEIKTAAGGDPNLFDQPMNTHLEVSFTVESADAELDRIISYMDQDQRAGFHISQRVNGSEEHFLVNPKLLGLSHEFSRGKKSYSKLVWKGKVCLPQATVSSNWFTLSA